MAKSCINICTEFTVAFIEYVLGTLLKGWRNGEYKKRHIRCQCTSVRKFSTG